jgi:hypothetical protein
MRCATYETTLVCYYPLVQSRCPSVLSSVALVRRSRLTSQKKYPSWKPGLREVFVPTCTHYFLSHDWEGDGRNAQPSSLQKESVGAQNRLGNILESDADTCSSNSSSLCSHRSPTEQSNIIFPDSIIRSDIPLLACIVFLRRVLCLEALSIQQKWIESKSQFRLFNNRVQLVLLP